MYVFSPVELPISVIFKLVTIINEKNLANFKWKSSANDLKKKLLLFDMLRRIRILCTKGEGKVVPVLN
jgi:hypothetical protein